MNIFVQTLGPSNHVLEAIRLGQPRVVKVVEPDAGWIKAIRAVAPDCLIVARLVRDHSNNLSARAGELFADEVKIRADSLQVQHWEGSNEAATGDLESVKRLTEFEVAFARRLSEAGLFPLVGGFSTGTPDIMPGGSFSMEAWETFYPAVREAWGYHFHEYWDPTDLDDRWNAFRYLKFFPHFPPDIQAKPGLISELGIDGGIAGHGRAGWRSYLSPESYLIRLQQYADTLRRFPSLAATIFCAGLGPDPSWKSFDIANSPILDELARAWRMYPSRWAEPSPQAGRRLVVADSLPSHPHRRYDLRPLADVSHVMIHHSGSAPPHDSLRHVQAIARYHVSSDQLAKGGAPGIAYHRVIAPDGTTFLTQPLERITWHAGSPYWNARSVAICLLGDFSDDPPSPAALAALKRELTVLFSALPHPPAVIGHRAVRSTSCPGNAFTQLLIESALPARLSDYDRGWNDCLNSIGEFLSALRK